MQQPGAIQQVSKEDEDMLKLLFYGDISGFSKQQQGQYLVALAKFQGLNPWMKPFDMIPNSQGKLIVYANKGAASQLRERDKIEIEMVYRGPLRMGKDAAGNELFDNTVYEVEVLASKPDSVAASGFRKMPGIGTISIHQLVGEAKANAIMKCWTKAVRRTTLDISGIGLPDESELGDWGGGRGVATEPQRRAPQALPRAMVGAGPYDAQEGPSSPAGEVIDTQTGEILDVTPSVVPGGAGAAPGPVSPGGTPPPPHAPVAAGVPTQPVPSPAPPPKPPTPVTPPSRPPQPSPQQPATMAGPTPSPSRPTKFMPAVAPVGVTAPKKA